MSARDETISIVISGDELALLKKLDFPCSDRVLGTAQPTEEGLELTGSRAELESLAGWVAGEANDARRNPRSRRSQLLDSVADELESALTSYRW